jgi:hypothetical protein
VDLKEKFVVQIQKQRPYISVSEINQLFNQKAHLPISQVLSDIQSQKSLNTVKTQMSEINISSTPQESSKSKNHLWSDVSLAPRTSQQAKL